MWARIARFEGDPADVDARIERLRSMLESDGVPPELADAKFLLLVDRTSGGALGVTLFESEEAMRRGDDRRDLRTAARDELRELQQHEVAVPAKRRAHVATLTQRPVSGVPDHAHVSRFSPDRLSSETKRVRTRS